ncbi:MAG TPA: rhomboid family intramembrane serine protease, partial [Sphingomicrobium sp.]|nr:rhomboid family intramembrane serine protease [Sphingomicrobium sp.]
PRTATIIISIVTAACWLLTGLLGASDRADIIFGVIPARLSGLIQLSPAAPAWLTPLTATLVHGNFLHLALNLLMLVWCGTQVERILGSGPMLLLYAVGAYTAAIAQWLVAPLSPTPMIGASGAISAVIGAFALSFGQQKKIVSSPSLNRSLNALWLLVAWIVLQVMTGLLGGLQGFMLATPAHIGGFIAGLLLQRPLLLWRYRNA